MNETFFLSITILILIVYSVKNPTLKISLLVLLFISCWASIDFFLPWQNGFLTINS